jgi:hypothetical protein
MRKYLILGGELLTRRGFYRHYGIKPESDIFMHVHDVCDHLLAPSGEGWWYEALGFIPPTDKGEEWAQINSLARLEYSAPRSAERFQRYVAADQLDDVPFSYYQAACAFWAAHAAFVVALDDYLELRRAERGDSAFIKL